MFSFFPDINLKEREKEKETKKEVTYDEDVTNRNDDVKYTKVTESQHLEKESHPVFVASSLLPKSKEWSLKPDSQLYKSILPPKPKEWYIPTKDLQISNISSYNVIEPDLISSDFNKDIERIIKQERDTLDKMEDQLNENEGDILKHILDSKVNNQRGPGGLDTSYVPSGSEFSSSLEYSTLGYSVSEDGITNIVDEWNNCGLSEDDPEFISKKIYKSNLQDIIVRKMISFVKDSLDFSKICLLYSIDSSFIEEFIDYIDFDSLSKNSKTREDSFKIIDDFKDKFDWSFLSKNIDVSDEFLEKYYENIVWDSIIENTTFTENQMKKYSSIINWKLLGSDNITRELSPDFVRENFDKLQIESKDKIEKIFKKLNVHSFSKDKTVEQPIKPNPIPIPTKHNQKDIIAVPRVFSQL